MKKEWMSFDEARKEVRKIGFKSMREYYKTKNNYKILDSIPFRPKLKYKKEWAGYRDWLWSEGKYLPFQEVKNLARQLGIQSASQWYKWAKSGNLPKKVPVGISQIYKDEWVSWYDFFGKKPKNFISYKKAKKLMEKLNIKSEKEYYKLDRNIYDLPGHPEEVYQKRWKNWDIFLNKDRRNRRRIYTINHDYFKKFSHDMAYILGLIFADGYIGERSIGITLHKNDTYLLQKVLDKLGYSGVIHSCNDINCGYFRIESIHIVKDIIKVFKHGKKYLRHGFPQIPKKYLPDFIRGFWDGDGCIYYDTNGKSYRSSLACAHLDLLTRTHLILKTNIKNFGGAISKTVQSKGKIICGHPLSHESIVYHLVLGPNDTRRLRDFMYSTPSDIKMIRKYEKFVKAGKIYLAPEDRRGSYWGFYAARKYVRKLNIKTIKEWNKYCASGNKPDNIPSIPKRIYKEWSGYKDWFGNKRKYLPFNKAREIIRKMKLANLNEWYQYIRSGSYRKDIPTHPYRVYKQWKGYYNWLGNKPHKMLYFKDAIRFVRKLGLKNNEEWRQFATSDKRPNNIPYNPDYTYKNKGWKNYKHWLGTER